MSNDKMTVMSIQGKNSFNIFSRTKAQRPRALICNSSLTFYAKVQIHASKFNLVRQ